MALILIIYFICGFYFSCNDVLKDTDKELPLGGGQSVGDL